MKVEVGEMVHPPSSGPTRFDIWVVFYWFERTKSWLFVPPYDNKEEAEERAERIRVDGEISRLVHIMEDVDDGAD